jgi:hypothetical protein
VSARLAELRVRVADFRALVSSRADVFSICEQRTCAANHIQEGAMIFLRSAQIPLYLSQRRMCMLNNVTYTQTCVPNFSPVQGNHSNHKLEQE